ncbi:MAG: prephenate/arogenate dehydrogenase [Pegethrix bostrychoides GSE-TBD4-15B]|jgi:arogenate dehydrogenase (NADP+)|uniref:Prephenate/arogenate dehydrogenase n=1 Tax=Pegethrix bostrychoides GSE-TBD4-15B TaxID=2839662 RepID=A0A951PB40_9CYAN|nr:prephenate/arogenate dehydrogenase [Pegethrix bostrychoides GSE-TBD4-15B]
MRIGIVGLGLIGGSLAIDLRRQGHHLLGVSRRLETCQQAVRQGIVDQAEPEMGLMADAEVVFLCTPLGALAAAVAQLLPQLSPAAILTDVGSVKAPVVDQMAAVGWSNFVGGHPMAGKAESGLEAAEAGLFVDRAYVLTPVETTPPAAVETVAALAQSLHSQIYYCDPAAHDRAVAWISHLPVMLSASLIAACLAEPDASVIELAQSLASSGFRDTSRVGGGNPELGVMMARYNQSALLESLLAYREQLDQMIQSVQQQNWLELEQKLIQTQQGRSKFTICK